MELRQYLSLRIPSTLAQSQAPKKASGETPAEARERAADDAVLI
jgi:hypothetical protein